MAGASRTWTCFASPLAVPKIAFALERQAILTAAPSPPRCIRRRRRFGGDARHAVLEVIQKPDFPHNYAIFCNFTNGFTKKFGFFLSCFMLHDIARGLNCIFLFQFLRHNYDNKEHQFHDWCSFFFYYVDWRNR